MKLLYEYLTKKGYDVVATREPGATAVGHVIRDTLLNPDFKDMSTKAEALLFAASRAQHVAEVIKPALEQRKIVLCDRYTDSSLAYQSFGRGLPFEEIRRMSEWASEGLEPALTIFLHVPVRVALERLGFKERDRIEQENLDFHQKVSDGYLELARMFPYRIKIIDGTKDRDEIHKEIIQLIEELLRLRSDTKGCHSEPRRRRGEESKQ
jgi:dTMP kinase